MSPNATTEARRVWRREYEQKNRARLREQNRQRRKRYAGTCLDCGKPTDGSNGKAKAPARCYACARRARVVWTREAVIAAIQKWAAHYGEPPVAWDWVPAVPGYPTATAVYGQGRPFAKWADAIETAGFPRRRQGERRYWKPDA